MAGPTSQRQRIDPPSAVDTEQWMTVTSPPPSVACLTVGLSFAELPVDVDAGVIEVSVLGDAGDVERAVDPSVAAEVESVLHGTAVALAR